MMSRTPTYCRTCPLASVLTISLGTPNGRACMAAVPMVVPAELRNDAGIVGAALFVAARLEATRQAAGTKGARARRPARAATPAGPTRRRATRTTAPAEAGRAGRLRRRVGGGRLSAPADRLVDSVEVGAAPEAIWTILDDPAALGRILPGCESIVARRRALRGGHRLEGQVHDGPFGRGRDPPRGRPTAPPAPVLDGRPRGLGGSFRLDVPFDIEPIGPDRSTVRFSVGLELGGSLSGFGGPMLTDALSDQIGDLVRTSRRSWPRDHRTASPSRPAGSDPARSAGLRRARATGAGSRRSRTR
jgi:carbon monoxide dehydrogenase subunit G